LKRNVTLIQVSGHLKSLEMALFDWFLKLHIHILNQIRSNQIKFIKSRKTNVGH